MIDTMLCAVSTVTFCCGWLVGFIFGADWRDKKR